MYTTTLTIKQTISTAHRLIEFVDETSPCHNIHGHNYDVLVEFTYEGHGAVKALEASTVKRIIKQFDHKLVINYKDTKAKKLANPLDIIKLKADPTVEQLAYEILWRMIELAQTAEQTKFLSISVTISETDTVIAKCYSKML